MIKRNPIPNRARSSARERERPPCADSRSRARPTPRAARRPKPKTRRNASQDRFVNTTLICVPLNTNRCACDCTEYRSIVRTTYKRCPCTNTGASRFSQAASPLRHAPRHALPLHGVAHPPDPPAPSLSPPQMRNSSAKAAHASCQLPSRLRCIPGQKPKRAERILPGQSRAD